MTNIVTRRVYPRPPIVEAVINFGFAEEVDGQDLSAALEAALGSQYPGAPQQQEVVEVSTKIRPDSLDTSARRLPRTKFLRSADGLRLLGCGAKALSVHVLAPYPGWERFLEQAQEALCALPSIVRDKGLASVGVRYIDRIILPAGVRFSDFLTVMPPCPEGMPNHLSGFHTATQTLDPSDGTIATLTLASAGTSEASLPTVVWDLVLQRNRNPRWELGDTAWLAVLEDLHIRSRSIFEASITDSTRELFQ